LEVMTVGYPSTTKDGPVLYQSLGTACNDVELKDMLIHEGRGILPGTGATTVLGKGVLPQFTGTMWF
jgi:hypothetical protein